MLIRAYFCLILSCVLWSLNPVANKYALLELAVPQLVFLRTTFTAIVMLVIALLLGYSFRLKQIGWKPFILGIIETFFLPDSSLTSLKLAIKALGLFSKLTI